MKTYDGLEKTYKGKKRCIFGLILITLITAIFYIFPYDVYQNQKSYKKQLIRFHVLANSDSKEDQALKLKVRDQIIKELNPKLEKSKSLEESRNIIKENLQTIKKVAKCEIKNQHYDYSVEAKIGNYDFPTKNYGSITLPAGNYEAVRVVIGKGEGANWWCVLFPPLCFIDMENSLTDQRTEEEMKSVLTEDEFKMIQTASEEELPVHLKFKVVEVLEHAKLKMHKFMGMK